MQAPKRKRRLFGGGDVVPKSSTTATARCLYFLPSAFHALVLTKRKKKPSKNRKWVSALIVRNKSNSWIWQCAADVESTDTATQHARLWLGPSTRTLAEKLPKCMKISSASRVRQSDVTSSTSNRRCVSCTQCIKCHAPNQRSKTPLSFRSIKLSVLPF